jgi:transcriptional regulator with XRE-family HTH domain
MDRRPRNHAAMPRSARIARKRPPAPRKPLYIGQWIRALGFKQRDVVKATGINEGYLSELIKGDKDNPSATVLMQIAEFLEIPLGYLYRPPPDREFIEQAGQLDAATIARLKTN